MGSALDTGQMEGESHPLKGTCQEKNILSIRSKILFQLSFLLGKGFL